MASNLLFLLIFWLRQARRVPRRHIITSRTWWNGLSLFQKAPTNGADIFVLFFLISVASRPNLFPVTDYFWDSLPLSSSSQSSESISIINDHFEIYSIVTIELNSIQVIELVSVIRVVCYCLGSVSIWLSWSSEHYLRRLGRSGRSLWKPGFVNMSTQATLGELTVHTFSSKTWQTIYMWVG